MNKLYSIYFLLLIILSIYDIRSQRVPAKLLVGGSFLSVAYLFTSFSKLTQPWQMLMTALIPGLVLLLGAKLTGKIGYADGWIILLNGIFLGAKLNMATFCLSLFLIGITSMLLMLLQKLLLQKLLYQKLFFRKGMRNMRLPYIPFLTLAVLFIALKVF